MDTEIMTEAKEAGLDQPPIEELKKKRGQQPESQNAMTSSTVSSLASPSVDSGVQLLDSESELTSVMSVSGFGCDQFADADKTEASDVSQQVDAIAREMEQKIADLSSFPADVKKDALLSPIMTKSDIDNQNFTREFDFNYKIMSASVPNHFFASDSTDDVFEMEHPIAGGAADAKSLEGAPPPDSNDVMNLSLNSYELLDYTLQNKENLSVDEANNEQIMHVSMSEEVNENMKVVIDGARASPIPEHVPVLDGGGEEQIVFRRQRKKKSKSDTPKKRVSFHEDILNSTKIDDIHINHGFITHESDLEGGLSIFQLGSFKKKPYVVKGRYSWAAEGDAPFYENKSDRQVQSDLIANNTRYSSSSSSGSASSSIDEEEDDENAEKKMPDFKKQPKSSCLKKTKHKIDTNIVQEANPTKKRDSLLLDGNIFGSLKSILNFSTSAPLLAERGVPEGQEDIIYSSSSYDVSKFVSSSQSSRKNSCGSVEIVSPVEPVQNALEIAKSKLKLTKNEGFYPTCQPQLPVGTNIIVCDSDVYEHKGISYSYEYDKFSQDCMQNPDNNKPKSSTIYQKILKEFNFFKRKAKTIKDEDFEFINPDSRSSTPPIPFSEPKVDTNETNEVEEVACSLHNKKSVNKYASSTKLDWSDDGNSNSGDFFDNIASLPISSRHLSSPKRRIRPAAASYQNSPLKIASSSLGMGDKMKSTSKSSLINRFLRNVTIKKMLDAKAAHKQKNSYKLPLVIKNCNFKYSGPDAVDKQLEAEIIQSQDHKSKDKCDRKLAIQLRKDLFRHKYEKLLGVYSVRSAYATNGDSKPLILILTNETLYIAGMKTGNAYFNHFVLPFGELNTILIGPHAQTVHFSNYDKDMQCLVTTGCSQLTGELMAQLEVAMRRRGCRLPAIKQLSMQDMANLRKAICKQTSVDKDEEYYYYSVVNIQDCDEGTDLTTPMGPNKEGPLMFQLQGGGAARWETAYFILKAGVLYMLSSASQRVPMRVFPLINGSCQGARRIFNCHRPHTFQLIVEGQNLQLAAPDEYVASEWLQELIHAASGTYQHKEKTSTQSCSLLMTSDHILTVREAFQCTISTLFPSKSAHQPIKGAQALSCASICDLTAFRLPSAEQSWCILEFACREVHEYSGDWILYFSTNSELETFIAMLEMLWTYNNESNDSFPLSMIPETDPLNQKCVDVYTSLMGNWSGNTYLQFV